jgi:hypothetical protein
MAKKYEPFDRIAKDGFFAERAVHYGVLYPKLREVAHRLGYALTLHGSLQTDLDVVAVPWVEDAAPEQELVTALVEACGGYLVAGRGEGVERFRTRKPHGRQVWTIHLDRAGYIDLGVMPRIQ